MSAQTIHDAYMPALAAHKEEVMAETWGHLAPKKNQTYTGRIVFAVGIYGNDELNPTAIFCEFEGLDDSPWFFDELQDFLYANRGKSGYVYEFNGTFRNYRFKGKIKTLLNANKEQRS